MGLAVQKLERVQICEEALSDIRQIAKADLLEYGRVQPVTVAELRSIVSEDKKFHEVFGHEPWCGGGPIGSRRRQ